MPEARVSFKVLGRVGNNWAKNDLNNSEHMLEYRQSRLFSLKSVHKTYLPVFIWSTPDTNQSNLNLIGFKTCNKVLGIERAPGFLKRDLKDLDPVCEAF